MADFLHVDVAKAGADEISIWRQQHPHVCFDLRGAPLRETDLGQADLHGADLQGADLVDADLSGANLDDTDISGADLTDACLARASLRAADCTAAGMRHVDFEYADLTRANLTLCDLRRATLRRANLTETILHRVNLIEANLTEACLRKANLRQAIFADMNGKAATLTRADLTHAILTTEQDGTDRASFLDLAAAIGLETSTFESPQVLNEYLARAFAYAHRPDVPEANEYPGLLGRALSNIQAIWSLYVDAHVAPEVVQVVGPLSAELIRQVGRTPALLYDLSSRQFEELVAELLAGFGWHVQLNCSTKDGGFDIFAISQDASRLNTSWIIECKRYKHDHKVGVEIVRALYGVKTDLRIANAVLATTSQFTRGVYQFKASHYDLELRDIQGLLDWVNSYRPHPGGRLYIRDQQLVVP